MIGSHQCHSRVTRPGSKSEGGACRRRLWPRPQPDMGRATLALDSAILARSCENQVICTKSRPLKSALFFLLLCRIYVHNGGMKYGYARVSPGGKSESVDAQARQLTKAGRKKVFRDVHVSGAKADRLQLRRVIETLQSGDVLMVTRLNRLARSTRDLLNTLAAITERKAGFRSLGDAWADTTTSHGRLMLTVLGGLAEFERDLIRTRTGEGRERAK